MSDLETPFRARYERSLQLDLQSQVEECVDYLQHPEVLLAEFLESYYQIEGKLDPEREDEQHEATLSEIVLEPFHDAMVLNVRAGSRTETVRCVGGAFAPIPGEAHPALEQQGLDYVGIREGAPGLVLGVTDAQAEVTVFTLLLRALNCLAELAPPFQLARLKRHVLGAQDAIEPRFDLQLGTHRRPRGELETSLVVLTRDLAEVFKRLANERQQLTGSIGRIECVEFGNDPSAQGLLRARWRA